MQWRHFWKLGWDVDGMRSFKKDVPFFVCDWIRSIFSARQQEAIDEIIESVELNIELVTALQFPNRVEYISENRGCYLSSSHGFRGACVLRFYL